MTHRTPIASALWLAAALASPSAQGQTVSVAELAHYDGPDRARRILEGAKREGEMSLYTSLTAATAAKVKADFERRFGVRINLWRASSEAILQRVTSEARAGRADFDVVETNPGRDRGIGHSPRSASTSWTGEAARQGARTAGRVVRAKRASIRLRYRTPPTGRLT